MKNKKLYAIISGVLFLTFISTIYLGKKKENKLYRSDLKDYQEWLVTEADSRATKQKSDEEINFYGKLMQSMDVNILILGDEISLSDGSSDYHNTWYSLFKSWLESTYRAHTTLKVLGESGATAYRGKEIFDAAKDTTDFDLVITCFGRNDMANAIQVSDFSQNYNDLIYALRSKNNNCIILPLLSNDLPENNDYRNATIQLCNDNSLKYVDALDGFVNSGIPVNTLTANNLPADSGYKIYANCFSKIISQEVTRRLIMQ